MNHNKQGILCAVTCLLIIIYNAISNFAEGLKLVLLLLFCYIRLSALSYIDFAGKVLCCCLFQLYFSLFTVHMVNFLIRPTFDSTYGLENLYCLTALEKKNIEKAGKKVLIAKQMIFRLHPNRAKSLSSSAYRNHTLEKYILLLCIIVSGCSLSQTFVKMMCLKGSRNIKMSC